MRHRKTGRKLGTDASHTKAIKKSLVSALFLNDRIKTVEARAKEIRGDVDKIITWAKRGDLHSRRLAIAALGDKELVREIFEKVAQGMFADRQGGYTRIMKLGNRKGDNAPVVMMELVTEAVSKKTEATPVKTAAKKAAPKKAATASEATVAPEATQADDGAEATNAVAEEATAETVEATTDGAEAANAVAEEAAEGAKPAETAEVAEAPAKEAKEAPAKEDKEDEPKA